MATFGLGKRFRFPDVPLLAKQALCARSSGAPAQAASGSFGTSRSRLTLPCLMNQRRASLSVSRSSGRLGAQSFHTVDGIRRLCGHIFRRCLRSERGAGPARKIAAPSVPYWVLIISTGNFNAGTPCPAAWPFTVRGCNEALVRDFASGRHPLPKNIQSLST